MALLVFFAALVILFAVLGIAPLVVIALFLLAFAGLNQFEKGTVD